MGCGTRLPRLKEASPSVKSNWVIRHPVDEEVAAVLGPAELLARQGMLHVGNGAALIPGNRKIAMDVDIVVKAVWNNKIKYCRVTVCF